MKAYDLNTNFTFGKYEGKPLEEVFRTDPEYVQKCMITVEDFAVDERSMQKLFEMYPDAEFSDQAIDANLDKLDAIDGDAADIFEGEEGYDNEDFEDFGKGVGGFGKDAEGDDFEDIEDDSFLESSNSEDDWDDDDDFR